MSAQGHKKLIRSNIFWICLTGLTTGVMVLALLCGALMREVLIRKTLTINPEEAAALGSIQAKETRFGALRIDTEAIVPQNRWVTYEMQLRDLQGTLLASAIKEAWNESGTWYEDGESGTWDESSLISGLDVRSNQAEMMNVVVQVLEHTDTSGQDIDEPVQFTVIVQNGVVDSRYLWAGLVGTTSLTALSLYARRQSL